MRRLLLAAAALATVLASSAVAPAMAAINPGAWVQVLPVQDRNNTILSAVQAVPAGLSEVDVRMDVPATGVLDPFVVATEEVILTIELSYDGGATFPAVESAPFFGSPTWDGTTGGWGKSGGPPIMGLQFSPDHYPTHFKAGYQVVTGPVSFGVSAQAN